MAIKNFATDLLLLFCIISGVGYLINENYVPTNPTQSMVYSKDVHGDNYYFVINHSTGCDAQFVIDNVYNTMDVIDDKGFKDHLVDVLGAVVSDKMNHQEMCFTRSVTVYPERITVEVELEEES